MILVFWACRILAAFIVMLGVSRSGFVVFHDRGLSSVLRDEGLVIEDNNAG